MKKALYMLCLIPLSVLSMLTVIYLAAKDEPFFFLKNIKVNGIQQLADHEILGKVSPFLRESLIKIDIEKMQEAISAHPFIKAVRIKRVYPVSLVIDVEEKKPSALWVDGTGEVRVLDESGEPFRTLAKGDVKGLFIVNAKKKDDAKMAYREVHEWLREGIIKKEVLSDVVCDDGNMTVFGYEDGIEIILGKEDYRGRLKRALTVLGDAKKRGFLIKCIDARVEKGAIIKERQG